MNDILNKCIRRSFRDKVNLSDILILIKHLMMTLLQWYFIIQSTMSKIIPPFDRWEPYWVAWWTRWLERCNLIVVFYAGGTPWMMNNQRFVHLASLIMVKAKGTQGLLICMGCKREWVWLFPQVQLLLFYLCWMIGIVYNLKLVFDFVAHSNSFLLASSSFNAIPNITTSRC